MFPPFRTDGRFASSRGAVGHAVDARVKMRYRGALLGGPLADGGTYRVPVEDAATAGCAG